MSDDVETLRNAYEALNHGDIEGALAVLDEDAEWSEHSDLPEAGVYRGRAAIRAFLQQFLESWRDFHQETEELIAGDSCVLVMLRSQVRGKGSGVAVEATYAHLWTMRDGRGVHVDAYLHRDEALRAMRHRTTAER